MIQKLRGNSEGFTLIELMIVIAIIGILAAIAIPNFIAYRDKAYCSRAETDSSSVLAAVASYFSEPTNTQIPGIAMLRLTESLSLNNASPEPVLAPVAGTGLGHGETVWVSVNDNSGRCPREFNYHVAMGADTSGYWD
jgi:prepilin-type N-terminal cleavage/methylation domain-containing protein